MRVTKSTENIIVVLMFIIAGVLLAVIICFALLTSSKTYAFSQDATAVIAETAIPLAAPDARNVNTVTDTGVIYASEQDRLNAEYPIDKSKRDGEPVCFIPVNFADSPWEATFPELERQYKAAVAKGYKASGENKCHHIVSEINNKRAGEGLSPLSLITHGNLYMMAYIRAVDITEKYSHERPDGTDILYSMTDPYLTAEILNGKATVTGAIQSWFDSPEHLEAILLPDINEIAIVCIETDDIETIGRQVVLFGNRNCKY